MGPTKVWGVFLGWALKPGGQWNGRYFCAALTEFIGMDLRVGGHIRVQEVYEVDFDAAEVYFPLKSLNDRAHGTLEGLTAPYGTVGDVAPQGLHDLGIPRSLEDAPPAPDAAGGVVRHELPAASDASSSAARTTGSAQGSR